MCKHHEEVEYEATKYGHLPCGMRGEDLVGRVLWVPDDGLCGWEKVKCVQFKTGIAKPYAMEIMISEHAGFKDTAEWWEPDDVSGCHLVP